MTVGKGFSRTILFFSVLFLFRFIFGDNSTKANYSPEAYVRGTKKAPQGGLGSKRGGAELTGAGASPYVARRERSSG